MALGKAIWVLFSVFVAILVPLLPLYVQGAPVSEFPLIRSESVLSVDLCRGVPVYTKVSSNHCIYLNKPEKIKIEEIFNLKVAEASNDSTGSYLKGYYISIKYLDANYGSAVNLMISCSLFKDLMACFDQKLFIEESVNNFDLYVTKRIYGPIISEYQFIKKTPRSIKQILLDLF